MEVAQRKTGNEQGQPLAVQPHDDARLDKGYHLLKKTFNILFIQDHEAQQTVCYHVTVGPLLKDSPELRTGDIGVGFHEICETDS